MDKQAALKSFERLLEIMDELRQKCPWDKKQTMVSLKNLTIEEVYELADAVVENKPEDVKKELGDLLLHIVFYSKIASESGFFDIENVIDAICEKLIYRHPHIYGTAKAENEEEVRKNWELLKLKEGNKSVLDGVPSGLPALIKAFRIQDKTASVGFDWEKPEDVWQKIDEELDELRHEVSQKNTDKMEAEFGDVLFSMINYARFLNINPETALERTNKKFISRFQYIEKQIGKPLSHATLSEMNALWEEAKAKI